MASKAYSEKEVFQIERVAKALANHNRVKILFLLQSKGELSLADIAEHFHKDYKTIAEHMRRLLIGGMVYRKRKGINVIFTLSPQGEKVLSLLQKSLK